MFMEIFPCPEHEFLNGTSDLWKAGRPCTSTTDTNIEKVRQLVRSDHRLTIHVIANEVGMDKETVCIILVDILGMRKVCVKMVPSLLTEKQKAQRLNACRDIFQQMEADEKLLENIITGEKSNGSFNMIWKQNDRVEDIKTSVMRHLKTITKDEFSQCFKAGSKKMEKCIKDNGKYFEGDK